jgi:hypothetical protein
MHVCTPVNQPSATIPASDPMSSADGRKNIAGCRSPQATKQPSVTSVGVVSYGFPPRAGPKIDSMSDYRLSDPRHRNCMPVRARITGSI